MNTWTETPGIETPETLTPQTPQMNKVRNETGKRLGGYFGPDWHNPKACLLKWSEAGIENPDKFGKPYFLRHPKSD